MSKSFTEKDRKILFVILAFVILAVFVVYHASLKLVNLSTSSIRMMAFDSKGQLWLVHQGVFYVMDEKGEILHQWDENFLDIPRPYSDMAFIDEDIVLVGSNETKAIYFVHQDGREDQVIDPAKTSVGEIFGIFHFSVHPHNKTIILSDTSNHRVVVMNREGTLLHSRGGPGLTSTAFHFPNELIFDGHDRIIVADTNHHALQVLDDQLSLIGSWKMSSPEGDSKYQWPVHLAIDGQDHIYVSLLDHNLTYGQILKFNNNGVRLLTFDLPEKVQPMAVLVKDNQLFIGDREQFRILRYGLDGVRYDDFGGPQIQRILQDALHQKKGYEDRIMYGRLILVLAFIPFLLTFVMKRKRNEKLNQKMSQQWIKVDEKKGRKAALKLIYPFVFAVILLFASLLIIFIVFLHIEVDSFNFLEKLLFVIGCCLFLLGPFGITGWSLYQMHLKGRYRPLFQLGAAKWLEKFSMVFKDIFSEGEGIIEYGLAWHKRMLLLTVLTNKKFYVISFDMLENQLYRLQEIDYGRVKEASLNTSLNKWQDWVGFPFTQAGLSFFVAGMTEPVTLKYIDHEAAKNIFKVLQTHHPEGDQVSNAIRDRCLRCHALFDGSSHCPHCGELRPLPAKVILLSFLLPGSGQFLNRQFLKGLCIMVFFIILAYSFSEIFIAYMYKTKEVLISQLIVYGAYAFFIWVIANVDAVIVYRRNKSNHWGIVVNESL